MKRAKGRPLPSSLSRRLTLLAYSRGKLSRAAAMNRLGMTWYGQLLDALGAEGLRMPQLPAATNRAMVAEIKGVLSAAKSIDA